MSAIFDACFSAVIGEEGGYTNDPQDPGGETQWGISKRAYPTLNIATLTKADAEAIYLRDYWKPCSCDFMPAPLAMLVFDAAVNNGQERARDWLQLALGVKADGIIGPQTMKALAYATGSPEGVQSTCAEFLARRIDFMGALGDWNTFGLGWSRRLAALPWKAMAIASIPTTEGPPA